MNEIYKFKQKINNWRYFTIIISLNFKYIEETLN